MKTPRFLCIMLTLLLLFTTFSSTTYGEEILTYKPSSWAVNKIEIAKSIGLIPQNFDQVPYTNSITRQDFCSLLIRTCEIYSVPFPSLPNQYTFSDTENQTIEYTYRFGLAQGTASGMFSPSLPLTREMAAVMLSRLCMLFQFHSGTINNQESVTISAEGIYSYKKPLDDWEATDTISYNFTDGNQVSEWSKTFVADMFNRGIMNGTGGGKIAPKLNITREQAVVLALNALSYCDETKVLVNQEQICTLPAPTGYFSDSYHKNNLLLSWNPVTDATAYNVTIFQDNNAKYSVQTTEPYIDLCAETTDLYETIFGSGTTKINAALQVAPVNKSGLPSVNVLNVAFDIIPWSNRNEMLFGNPNKNRFDNHTEALQYMTTISVNVWKLTTAGEKVASTMTLTVNKNVADDVASIFQDIFNGNEKFPIKSLGGYAYRDGNSEHSYGTAIDINPVENYFVTWSGQIKVGSLWQPGVNPYSIVPGGDVTNAFNRYGWYWSPDRHWDSGADYMHFSLGGK